MPPEVLSSRARPILAEVGLADHPEWIVLVVCAWAAVGLMIGATLARRGHDPRPLAALGLVLGPLLYGYARISLRGYEQVTRPVVVRDTTDHGGHLSVLVTVLGEPDQVVDALPVLRLVAPHAAGVQIGRLVTYDVARIATTSGLDAAIRELETSAVFLHDLQPGLVLIPGSSTDDAHRYASDHGIDVVVIVDDTPDVDPDRRLGGRAVTVVMGDRQFESDRAD